MTADQIAGLMRVWGRVDSNSHEAPRVGVSAAGDHAHPPPLAEASFCSADGGELLVCSGVASEVINLYAGEECATGINATKLKRTLYANSLTSYRGESHTTTGVFPV